MNTKHKTKTIGSVFWSSNSRVWDRTYTSLLTDRSIEAGQKTLCLAIR